MLRRLVPTVLMVIAGLVPNLSAEGLNLSDGIALIESPRHELDWARRQSALTDPNILPISSRQPLSVEPGQWGWMGVRMRAADVGQRPFVPGDAPIAKGGQLIIEANRYAAGSHWFVHADPEILVQESDTKIPHADPRSIWTGTDLYDDDTGTVSEVLRATVGVHGFNHVLAISNEAFHWGPSLFGGIVVGGAHQGFPHLMVTNIEPWHLFTMGDAPVLLRYEFAIGLLDDNRPGPDEPMWTGGTFALRWKNISLHGMIAEQLRGDGNPGPDPDLVIFDLQEGQDQNVNGIWSAGLAIDVGAQARFSVEYGMDDNHPASAKDSSTPPLSSIETFHPLSAAWIVTADWLNAFGSHKWRLATEWYRSEAYFYSHSLFGSWSYEEEPLAHPDGGNSNSIRLLIQHEPEPGQLLSLTGFWIERGWRNDEADNRNTRKNRGETAPRDWTQIGLAGWYERPLAGGTIVAEGHLIHEQDRLFEERDSEWSMGVGLGYRFGW